MKHSRQSRTAVTFILATVTPARDTKIGLLTTDVPSLRVGKATENSPEIPAVPPVYPRHLYVTQL